MKTKLTNEKTFENQNSLPRLPLPSVENTIKIYLKSLEPLYPPERVNEIRQKAKAFMNGKKKK